MPDILIRGMEMPRSVMVVSILNSGTVINYLTGKNVGNAVELQPHGDLIDRGAIKTIIENHFKNHKIDRYDRELLLHYLDDEMAPVIVQAEREATQ